MIGPQDGLLGDLTTVVEKKLQIKRRTLDATIGEIHKEVYLAIDGLCQKEKTIKSYLQANA